MFFGQKLALGRVRTLFRGLLDQFSGAAAAYSLRKLSSSTTNVVRVRRASDNDEKDFTASQVSSGEMVNWVTEGSATADGFVETWYDQSGNGRDATQSVAGNQPKIVDAGSLVAGGLDFDGANHYLLKTEVELIQTDDVLSLYTVSTIDDVSTRGRIVGDNYYNASSNNAGFIFEVKAANIPTGIAVYFDDVVQKQVGLASVTEASESLFSLTLNGGISGFYINGNLEESRSSTSMKSTVGEGGGGFVIGAAAWGLPFDGKIKEIIVYNSDTSGNRTAIEANINAHYDIYA